MNPLEIIDVSSCRRCPLLGKDHVPSSGSPQARLMILGQSPGKQEVEQGQPFVGPCGELVDMLLDEADLDRAEVYIANTLKCHPPGNRPGMVEEIRNCKDTWLKHEIKQLKPKVILILGKDAWAAIGPPKKFVHLEQNVHPKTKTIYLSCYHPSYFLRRGKINEFYAVGQIIKELLNGL